MKMALFNGLYAPAGKFFPPLEFGQTNRSSFAFVQIVSILK